MGAIHIFGGEMKLFWQKREFSGFWVGVQFTPFKGQGSIFHPEWPNIYGWTAQISLGFGALRLERLVSNGR